MTIYTVYDVISTYGTQLQLQKPLHFTACGYQIRALTVFSLRKQSATSFFRVRVETLGSYCTLEYLAVLVLNYRHKLK